MEVHGNKISKKFRFRILSSHFSTLKDNAIVWKPEKKSRIDWKVDTCEAFAGLGNQVKGSRHFFNSPDVTAIK
jgi:hypothetical protein